MPYLYYYSDDILGMFIKQLFFLSQKRIINTLLSYLILLTITKQRFLEGMNVARLAEKKNK